LKRLCRTCKKSFWDIYAFSVFSTRTGKTTPSTYLQNQLDFTRHRESRLPELANFAKVIGDAFNR